MVVKRLKTDLPKESIKDETKQSGKRKFSPELFQGFFVYGRE